MIGKYFRTKCGCIGKIVKTCNLFDIIASKEERELVKDLSNIELGFIADTYYNFQDEPDVIFWDDIIKSGENKSELLEEGDYIRLISNNYFKPVYKSYGKLVVGDDNCLVENLSNNFIAEILTKEQITKWSYCGDLDRRSERGLPHES